MVRLPSVLGSDDVPSPELYAARLDGEVIALHGSFVPIDEPDRPELRAQVLAAGLDRALILERRSAAWVHGAIAVPPRELQVCTPITARTGRRTYTGRVRELMLAAEEIDEFAGVRCTSRERTAFDLLRDPGEPAGPVVDVAGLLLGDDERLIAGVRARLDDSVRLPYRALARARLARILSGGGAPHGPSVQAAQPSATR